MKTLPYYLLLVAFLFPQFAKSQIGTTFNAVNDSICIEQGQPLQLNVTANDSNTVAGIVFMPQGQPDAKCFRLTSDGNLSLIDPNCPCGTYKFRYFYEGCQPTPVSECSATVTVVIKCPKPDCFFFDMADFKGSNAGEIETCAKVCEKSASVFSIAYNPLNTYNWAVTGGTFTPGGNPAEIVVTWGAAGNGTVSLNINGGTPQQVCVDILTGPTASFTKSSDTLCLGSTVYFTNTSVGASASFWDFGDGNTSNAFSPSHQYAAGGTYTVCLTVTKNNYDLQGNPLCCCTDSMCMDIFVDSTAGPKIYCVSTLCAGDKSCYWTDAQCTGYDWMVLDHNGLPLPFTGDGTDTICVQWGPGPVGTVALQVTGCTPALCNQPVSVNIPIISATAPMGGPVTVCANSSATYTVPKWMSVYYDWTVMGGTVVAGGDGTNTITIQWGSGPTGMVSVVWYSDFLEGLPGHSPGDCQGSTKLNVSIKPPFSLFGPEVVCFKSTSSISANPTGAYTWSVSPAIPFTGQGTGSISVNWNTVAGTFVVTAVPVNSTLYCNSKATKTIQVVQVPKPDSITGPKEICPGVPYTYFGHSSESGMSFTWTILGGTPATATGNPVTVTWNGTGPYSISAAQTQLTTPFCTSDTIRCIVKAKTLNGPIVISGPPACVNTVAAYTAAPAQHPEAVYNWTITPATAGSVISGQGTAAVQVQWNNSAGSATISVSVSLCSSTLTGTLARTISAAAAPTITQTGQLCPGNTATLSAGPGYSAYLWSPGGGTTQTITISTPGSYSVVVTNANGCTAIGTYQALPSPGPTASISALSSTILCILPANPASVTLTALTGPGYQYEWFCGATSQGLPSAVSTFTHNNTNVAGVFSYYVKVTAGGCTNTSNSITVVQDTCAGGPGGCRPLGQHTISFTTANAAPNCDVVTFTNTSTPNVTVTGWNFGDPNNNTNTGTLPVAVHQYSKAMCYNVIMYGLVPAAGGGFCEVFTTGNVCVPLVADFSCVESCQKVTFTDLSTFIAPQNITSWSWNFGDSGTSNVQNPMHTYLTGGTYTVTLTVTNAAGCRSVKTKTIVVPAKPDAAFTMMPVPACVGEPVMYNATGAGNVTWLWTFGDGGSNGAQNPKHTYLTAATYTVNLVVSDARGCTATQSQSIVVHPKPAAGTIAVAPGLSICAGGAVTLTAPAASSWLWSNAATTQTISVTTAGTYSVIIKDANGCTATPAPVTVVVLPLPDPTVTGNPVICDNGCTTLSAVPGYTYQWFDSANVPLTGETGSTLNVCTPNVLPGGYKVVVTDANGCSAMSAVVVVTVAVSPNFTVTITPDACEGAPPSTLTVVPVQPNVVYTWSNGANGPSITVLQAGTYVVTGVDTLTGCSHSASGIIHPLPDLCIVPVGCYEACNPDTICGPAGLTAYQWNLNGVPITGATQQCLIVTQSGTYSLTGTNSFGCTNTSDSLMLTLIDCTCDGLEVSATPASDSCCWNLTYSNLTAPLAGVFIYTNDADLNFDLGSLSPSLSIFAINNNSIGLVNSIPSAPLPLGTAANFIKFCMANVINTPQTVYFDWYDLDYEIFCRDSLVFDCPVEPDCLYLASDSIYCNPEGIVTYSMTVCNPIDAPFSIGFIQLMPTAPTGIVVTPPFINTLTNPIAPGDCRTFQLTLSGPNIAGQKFCFGMTAHESDPATVDTAVCCKIDTLYCIEIPDCDPCNDVGVDTVIAVQTTATAAIAGKCCYKIALYNNFAAGYFDGINLCMASPNTTMLLNNTFGSGWATGSYTPTLIQLNAIPPLGTAIPLGVVNLPTICINTTEAPAQTLVIKWMKGDSVVCMDSVLLECEPPCGYMLEDTILCKDGTWVYQGFIKNTSAVTMGDATISFTSPAGMSVYNLAIPFGALPPGGTFPFTLNIGAPAQAGDTVCFVVTLHEISDIHDHLNCCKFRTCIVLPECIQTAGCLLCDNSFETTVLKGFTYTQVLSQSPLTLSFAPAGVLAPCDKVTWTWSDGQAPSYTMGNQTVARNFDANTIYEVNMSVTRVDLTGQRCTADITQPIVYATNAEITEVMIRPNPSKGQFFVEPKSQTWQEAVSFRALNLQGQLVAEWNFTDLAGMRKIPLDMSHLSKGMYLLEVSTAGKRWILKVVMTD